MSKIRKRLLRLEDLKGLVPLDVSIYTNAEDNSEEITKNNQKGLNNILEGIGFQYAQEQYGLKNPWMYRWTTGKEEKLTYHQINKKDHPISNLAKSVDMKIRIYFCSNNPSNSIYDVVKTLLNEGYQVMVPPVGKGCIDRLFHFIPEKNEKLDLKIEEKIIRRENKMKSLKKIAKRGEGGK